MYLSSVSPEGTSAHALVITLSVLSEVVKSTGPRVRLPGSNLGSIN